MATQPEHAVPAASAPPSVPGSPGETRALLQILAAQSENANPLVAIAALVMVFTMFGRVETRGLLIWSALAVLIGVSRHLISRRMRASVRDAPDHRLGHDLKLMIWGSALNSTVMGTAFWLIAASGDMYVRMIVTLISLVHMTAVLLYLMPRVRDRLVCTAGNVIQGALFWLGVGTTEAPHWELLVVYCGLFWCGLVAGREQLRQFRESLRMRDENAALLAKLEREQIAVQAALEDARLANASKNRFLAAASHDLRQPLHALTMFLGTLGFHIAGDDGRRLLGRASATLRVLEEQFNSLLDLSRFDAGAVTATPRAFRLDDMLRSIADEFRPQAESKGVELTVYTVPALAWSDPLLLGRVLRNLVDNAVHYTPSGSIVLRVEAARTGFRVSIQDTGPGIPASQQARIFDEYVQLANPARQRQHGVGLGLAIVRRIDQLLGLALHLDSTEGRGSCFAIRVAAAAGGGLEAPSTNAPADPLQLRLSQHIWIVDDDPVVLEGLQAQLQAWGAEVQAFATPEPALEALGRPGSQPGWILTDDMLGETLTGLELAEAVAQRHPGVRVAIITGNTELSRLEALRASGHPVIVKPASPAMLAALLDEPRAALAVSPAA